MSRYPKSPKEMVGGMMYLPRMLDKIRLHAKGELGTDYQPNLGKAHAADGTCCQFLGVDHAAVTRRVLEGGTRAWQEAGLPVETGATKMLDEADDVVLKPYDKGRAAMEAYLRWEEQLDEDGQSPHALK